MTVVVQGVKRFRSLGQVWHVKGRSPPHRWPLDILSGENPNKVALSRLGHSLSLRLLYLSLQLQVVVDKSIILALGA